MTGVPTPPAEQTATPLAPLTTLRLGGPARRLIEVASEQELIATIRELDAAGEPLLVLAGGSNVVIADAGFDGTVVLVRTRGVERAGDELLVQAGEPWDGVVEQAVDAGLAGIEALSGIPGSTGATPIQNVGAYGQDVSQTITAVRVLDRRDGSVRELTATDCGFRYRTSAFKGRDDRIVLAVRFALGRAGAGGTSAGAAGGSRREALGARSDTPSSRARSASRPAGGPRSARCARRCSGCGAGRGWSSIRPIPTPSAPAPSSPTRSSRPTRTSGSPPPRPATVRRRPTRSPTAASRPPPPG